VNNIVTSGNSPLTAGFKLDRYELLCPIAEGGMASVWVARQQGKHGFEKLVAVKTILPKFAADLRFQEMFLDEARIASRIEHLNVAQIFDLGEEHEILYLVMEYVDGDALSKLNRVCEKKGVKIPPGVVLRVLSDACSGLHDAHELKDLSGKPLEIVHRDVSPHNILVSTKGIAKLIDFGIAKARSRASADTNSGVLKGKVRYMAPEQATGGAVDRRADLWAVGATLYHLIAGKPPYEGDNQLATLHLLGSGNPPAPLPPSVHPAIAAIVEKALTYDPEGRYATALEMSEALEAAMSAADAITSTADVAEFWAEHMAIRAERRRQAIENALVAAAEAKQSGPAVDPPPYPANGAGSDPPTRKLPSVQWSTSSSVAESATSSIATEAIGPPAASASPVPPLPGVEDIAPEQGIDAAAMLTPRVSTPPSHSSYATLGSAAIDASAKSRTAEGRSHKSLLLLGAGILSVAIAALVWFAEFRPSSAAQRANGSPGAATRIDLTPSEATPPELAHSAAPPLPPAAPPATAVAAPPPKPAPAAAPPPKPAPVVSAPPPVAAPPDVPPAIAPPVVVNHPPRQGPAASPTRRIVPPPTAPSPPKPKSTKTVDDGF
jgi:serine/threonine-protein kinase